MRSSICLFVFIIFSLSILVPSLSFAQKEEFDVIIDQKLQADPATIPDTDEKVRAVGVIVNPDGSRFQAVENEVIFKPEDPDDKKLFLERIDGDVINDGTLPDIPAKIQNLQRNIPESDGYYLVRFEPEKVNTQTMITNGNKLGLSGTYRCSSQNTFALFALCLNEWAENNTRLNANGVFKPDICADTSSQEYAVDPSAPNPALDNEGFADAYQWPQFADEWLSVKWAWQIIEMFGYFRYEVPLCVIDGGFQLNDDFGLYYGYDFVHEDYDPSGSERGCHGTGSLSMSCAQLDNQFGSAGTGAPVAMPMVFRHDWSFHGSAWAIRTAVSWGAEVISMSFGGGCNWWCDTFGSISGETQMKDAIDEAADHGIVLLASAGNDEINLSGSGTYIVPAECGTGNRRPIIVGAIDLNTKLAIREADGFSWGSNYGRCDIWAPGGPRGDIYSTPRPGDTDIGHFNGTSCACPFTAGIVAMMKALCPALTNSEARLILQDTSAPSADARVTEGYVQAMHALIETMEREDSILPQDDAQEPNDSDSPFRMSEGEYCGNLHRDDPEDYFMFSIEDFLHIQFDYDTFVNLGWCDYETNLGDPDDPWPLPFDDDLDPGTYYFQITPTRDIPVFYSVNYTIVGQVSISPDAYEANNTMATAASLIYPGAFTGDIWEIEDLNFHVNDDLDYFELTLPDLPTGLVMPMDERVQITVEATGDGFEWSSLHLQVYDPEGDPLRERYSRSLTIEDIRDTYPDGHIKFLIWDYWERRNFYRMTIGYDRWQRGIEQPSTLSFIEIPAWMEAESERHMIDPPPSAMDGVPFELPFPSDPEILELIQAGKTPDEVPSEIIVLKCLSDSHMRMDFEYEGEENTLNFGLLDDQGEVFIWAQEYVPKFPKALNKSNLEKNTIYKQIDVEKLLRGYHGLLVESKTYPHFYTTTITPIEKAFVQRSEENLPKKFELIDNYPNPFNSETSIEYHMKNSSRVLLTVYDIHGRLIKKLIDGYQESGKHKIKFNANTLSSGIYFYHIQTQDFQATKKMVLLE